MPASASGVPSGPASDEALAALRERLAGPSADVLADTAAESAAAAAARDLERDQWPDRPEVSYVDDPDAFDQVYEEARARRAGGADPVEYMTENATDGLGARNGGRAFGVEIEFDIEPGVDRYTALQAIGRDLHAAGLTQSSRQQPYHGGGHIASENHRGGWKFETDSTVAGEIVSPKMYDEPETWQNLAKVCEIVRRHGGIATTRTGGHVHVSLNDFDHTVENHNRLLQTAAGYQDTLYRLAQNPGARNQRGGSYCVPNRDPGRGYASIDSARGSNSGHLGLNFGSVHGTRADHAEFRMWDGSLRPGVIQAQINLSLGMTAAAARGGYTPPSHERIGTHLNRNPRRRRMRGQEWRDQTHSFRQLADTVFRRARNSAQAAALFASTRWQPAR
jgi:Putative amidoligase enzyme